MAAWLNPIELVQKIGGGYFQLADRCLLYGNKQLWTDVEHPSSPDNLYTDAYKISKVSCLFKGNTGSHQLLVDGGEDTSVFFPGFKLEAIQVTYQSVDRPEETVMGPLRGFNRSGEPWSHELELRTNEHLIGMGLGNPKISDVYFKTDQGRVYSMIHGEVLKDVWSLPIGFRIYGFHGCYDEKNFSFIGPIFKSVELKNWDQKLYAALPMKFKNNFQTMLLVRDRHRRHPPNGDCLNLWLLPEAAWDKVVDIILYWYYYDMDAGVFFGNISQFQCGGISFYAGL